MISINATLVVQIVQFLILVFILNRLMFQPILKKIEDRKEYVEKTKGEINDLEQEAERLKKKFISEQVNARKDAFVLRDELRNQAFGQIEESLRDSQEKADSLRATADGDADKEIEKTQPLLPGEAATLAEEIIERVIGRRIAA